MKKLLSLSLILLTLAFFAPAEAAAQTVKRIQFAKGKSSATVKGITGSYGIYYALRVKGGQKMTVSLSPTSKVVGIKIERDGGDEVLLREERGGTYTLYFEEGGEITIFVGSNGARSVPYTLSVSITRMTDI